MKCSESERYLALGLATEPWRSIDKMISVIELTPNATKIDTDGLIQEYVNLCTQYGISVADKVFCEKIYVFFHSHTEFFSNRTIELYVHDEDGFPHRYSVYDRLIRFIQILSEGYNVIIIRDTVVTE